MHPPNVVVVTGGTAGVGLAAVRAFAQRGDWIAILAREPDRLARVCSELRDLGILALGIPVDVADAQQVEAAASRIELELGLITIWVNNVSTTVFAPVAETTAAEYRRVTEVVYLGAVHGTLAALKRMSARNHGCIVQTGSALAYRSIPLQSAYCGAKAAIRGFTDSLRSELVHDHSSVRLTMVHLSAFNTPQFDWCRSKLPRRAQPVPPIFQPEIAGEAIVWAATHGPREVWAGQPPKPFCPVDFSQAWVIVWRPDRPMRHSRPRNPPTPIGPITCLYRSWACLQHMAALTIKRSQPVRSGGSACIAGKCPQRSVWPPWLACSVSS